MNPEKNQNKYNTERKKNWIKRQKRTKIRKFKERNIDQTCCISGIISSSIVLVFTWSILISA